MKIAVTGHRPNKLWGYNLNHPQYIALAKELRTALLDNGATHAISGMALGVDTIFAMIALNIKLTNPEFVLECAIPCSNQPSRWQPDSVALYNKILGKADIVNYISKQPYSASCMQKRNEYMVDNCDLLIAVWDGTAGGTANCVRYAQRVNKPILTIKP